MGKMTKKLSALLLSLVFASMQLGALALDTGLDNATINNTTGGFAGVQTGNNEATLNFTGDTHVNWNTLNVGADETLNFNAINGATGLTILNTVNSGMSEIYGQINANSGIKKLIISNPNGMLFDGASFTTAGDLQLTTQALGANFAQDGTMTLTGVVSEAFNAIKIKDSNFSVGGEFNIIAPSINIIGSDDTKIKAATLRLSTTDGQNYIGTLTSNPYEHVGVRLEAVSIDGDVYITTGKDLVVLTSGGDIKGNLNIETEGNVAMNYVHNGKVLNVTGDINSNSNAEAAWLRMAKVGGNVTMHNDGGFVEIANAIVGTEGVAGTGNVTLSTGIDAYPNDKHFVHVVGDNKFTGDLKIDSAHNIHIGGYDYGLNDYAKGSLTVGGAIDATARDGSVAITVDTTADSIKLTSGTKNIVTNGVANIKANNYEFNAKHYIGAITDKDYFIKTVMEDYTPLDVNNLATANPGLDESSLTYLNIQGGNVNKVVTGDGGHAYIRANDNMTLNGVNVHTGKFASAKDIVIKDDVVADLIEVGAETNNLTVEELKNRDYTLKYTDIIDTKVVTIAKNEEITYEKANGKGGWNDGIQTDKNTYLVVPGGNVEPPVTPPVTPPVNPPVNPDPVINPDDNENVKVMRNLNRDATSAAIDAGQVYTPVAFAADLDEVIDTGVRKNVDGSVTVVRPFTPSK